ncbi:sugar ABC transporter substrate-binding protein [Christensenella intestinihominis]|uniref:sugar ABC transporter substrate-binding protein n=1 Tax=Christensenella intestinihominis TaxID=1851429 RepID=UPI00082C437C|nr:substrate-binding domain-containing protein [Christensenella intestinihominis]
MKKLLGKQGVYMVLIAVVIFIFILFLSLLPLELDVGAAKTVTDYRYHFLIDTGQPAEYFSSEFVAGAKAAAEENDVLIEVAGMNSALDSGDEGLLSKGIFERVDGIIYTGRSVDTYERELLTTSDCVVLCVNNECNIDGISYVGPDNEKQGEEIIQTLDTRGKDSYNIVVMINAVEKELGNLRYEGMLKALKERSEINVLETIYVSSNVLDAMDQAQKSILAHPDIDCFIGTDETILTGITRGVVDLNRVPEIAIAGAGIGADVERYIGKGIIRFSLDPLPYEIGYEAVLQLCRQQDRKERMPRNIYTDYLVRKAPELEP